MKKLFFAALAATTLFASCAKESNTNTPSAETTQLTVKISGVVTHSRAVEAPGSDALGTIQLIDGHIFVLNALNEVVYNEGLVVEEATDEDLGQILEEEVASDSRVFIVGNIPSDAPAMNTLTTLDAILGATSAMTTQTDYTAAALANVNSTPVAIVLAANGEEATVDVSINPLISRLELVQIQGKAAADSKGTITAFTVTGVFVDDYHPSFTFAGGNSGNMFEQGVSTTFTGIGDTGSWEATGTPLVAAPASGDVWAHNVASSGLPRFIIRLENIEYLPVGGVVGTDEETLTGTYFLTVTGYTGITSTDGNFERGKIYRIGGDTGITFGPADLGLTPNPVDVPLTVFVEIVEWVIEDLTGNL